MVKHQTITDDFAIYCGDCVEVARSLPDNIIPFSISSWPFASLYTYSNSERDLGNCRTYDEFADHIAFLIPSLGLLHKQIKKDSAMSRQGIPDYLVVFRKPGENSEPVSHTNESFPVAMWQQYASPVWALTGADYGDGFCQCFQDINPSNTLQKESAREHKDERHICPLQKEVIARAIELWSNPGDIVYDPFGGIGTTGHMAIKMGRKTIMSELKDSYYRQAVLNCEAAKREELPLFSGECQ